MWRRGGVEVVSRWYKGGCGFLFVIICRFPFVIVICRGGVEVVSRWYMRGGIRVVSGWYQGGIRVVSGWYQGGIRNISDESSGFRNFCLVFGFSFLINRCPGQNSGIRTDF